MCSVLTEDLLSFIELTETENRMTSVKLQEQYFVSFFFVSLHNNR